MLIRRLTTVTAVAAVCLAVLTANTPAQQVDPLQAAIKTMGAGDLRFVRFSGFGASYSVGQSPSPRETSPRVTLKKYEADIDYTASAMRVQQTREQGPLPPRGGGQPFTGEQRLEQFVNGGDAWDVPVPNPVPALPPPPAPQSRPQEVAARLQQIWLTPHGFLRAASANGATTRRVPQGIEIAFFHRGKRYLGVVDRQNLVERVQTWVDHPVLGEMLVDVIYRDYEKVDGIMFPMHIMQSQGGNVSLDVWVSAVHSNVPFEVTTPDAVRGAQPPAVTAAGK